MDLETDRQSFSPLDALSAGRATPARRWWEDLQRSRMLWHAAIGAVVVVSLLLDIVLPRGATAAIGYAVVPVLSAVHRKVRFVLMMTALCTALTWIGYLLEQPGVAWWFSLFDRAMVSMVLWLSFLLVARQMALAEALADRTSALELATTELARSNEDLDHFASRVAHDLRGPLQGIGLAAQALIRHGRKNNDSEAVEWLESMRREMQWMSQLVQRLLTYGRMGGSAVSISDCDCNAVLVTAQESLSAMLSSSQALVTSDELPVLQADPVLIAELLQNLIENAVKYRGPSAPAIHFSAERDSDGWLISVRDNGVGIEPENASRIFDAFTQARRSGAGGIGLGLATCKRIVERHGGAITVTSVLNEGSTFWIRLPAGANVPTPPARSHASPMTS